MARTRINDDFGRTVDQFSNHELVTLAVYLCGGELRPVDTEDVAIKAHEIAPGRFAWRKYPEQISLDAVRKRLWDAQSAEKGYKLVSGSERAGWTLTPAGQEFCNTHLSAIESVPNERKRLSVDEKRWLNRERLRLLDAPAVTKVLAGRTKEVTKREAEFVFRLDAYVEGDARRRKIDRLINFLGADRQIGDAIRYLAKLVQSDLSA